MSRKVRKDAIILMNGRFTAIVAHALHLTCYESPVFEWIHRSPTITAEARSRGVSPYRHAQGVLFEQPHSSTSP